MTLTENLNFSSSKSAIVPIYIGRGRDIYVLGVGKEEKLSASWAPKFVISPNIMT